jgi:hypothetical protein
LEPDVLAYSKKNDVLVKLDSVYLKLWRLPISKVFRLPVDPSHFPDYSSKILNPICLSDIKAKIDSWEYGSCSDMLKDLKQMWSNAYLYNGPASWVTSFAREIFQNALSLVTDLFPDEEIGDLELEEKKLLEVLNEWRQASVNTVQ